MVGQKICTPSDCHHDHLEDNVYEYALQGERVRACARTLPTVLHALTAGLHFIV